MSKITYHHSDGRISTVEVPEGTSVMRAALMNSVQGIIGECGGQVMCATCHVYVRGGQELAEMTEDEDEMLECTSEDRRSNSRLACKLVAGRDFDELEVDLPTTQS